MARIVFGSYMVRYPLGGMLSCALQWLLGFQQLGHEVYFVEKSGYANACFDPSTSTMSDDCSYGVSVVSALLARFGLEHRWCFVDAAGRYHGLSRAWVEAVLGSADVFVDYGTHGSWLEEAATAGMRVLLDGEPGYTQIKMERSLAAGDELTQYDHYYTVGQNVGTDRSTAPTAERPWRHVFSPVAADRFPREGVEPGAPFTTVMNWQSHDPIEFEGRTYGQKDIEFARFVDLPRCTATPLEIAVAGRVPTRELLTAGWRVRNAHEVTVSYDSFGDYIRASAGEFGVCKNVFVATNSGWFSDRSAAYLASGRPVVLQDTGFREHLPCGRGLFAVRTADEAAAALDEIGRDYTLHSRAARDIAEAHLDAPRVTRNLLAEIGVD